MSSQHHYHRPTDPWPAAIRPLAGSGTGSAMVVARVLPAGSYLASTSRRACAYFGGGLAAAAANNLRRGADRTSRCVRDLDRFLAAEATLYLLAIQSEPTAAPAP